MKTPKVTIPEAALSACRTRLQGSPGLVRNRHANLMRVHEELCAQFERYQEALNKFDNVHSDYSELHAFVAEHDPDFAVQVDDPSAFEVPAVPAIVQPGEAVAAPEESAS